LETYQYSLDGESIDNIPRVATWEAARHQIYTIINPITGEEISEAERIPNKNRNRRRNIETSASNDDSAYTITSEELEITRNSIANRTPIPIRVSAGTLNAYHAIIEKNHYRLSKEQNDLDRHQQAAD
jgi:hypothetical protein